MSDSIHGVVLALAADAGADLPEMPVLYTGTFEHTGRKFDVTEADLDLAVENFNRQLAAGTEIPTDYEHGAAEGGIASGWYKSLRREGNRLLAKIAWTDKAREQIKAGARKYFSPEFIREGKDEHGATVGFKLTAGALVVRPHLKALGAVALSEDASAALAAEVSGDHLAIAREQLDVLVRLGELLTPTVPKDAPMAETTVTPKQVEDLTTALSEVRETVETLKTENVALSERADAAEQRAEATDKELASERLSAVLLQARREGRIDAKDETTGEFSELAEKIGLDGVKTILAKIPAETIPVSEQGHGRDKPITASDAPDGVDPDRHALDKRANELMGEGKTDDYTTAVHMAADELGVTL